MDVGKVGVGGDIENWTSRPPSALAMVTIVWMVLLLTLKIFSGPNKNNGECSDNNNNDAATTDASMSRSGLASKGGGGARGAAA